jgi:murein DD-endopeptidase MepM/ murein hydrolase activator NlpD
MNLQIVSGRDGRVRQLNLSRPRTLVLLGGFTLLLVAAVFVVGLALGRFLLGGNAEERAYSRALLQQKLDIQAARGQVEGQVDALASRIGTLNAQLIRLDALGRRLTDLANLDRGEFDFDKAPPAGGPEGEPLESGSVQGPELTAVLDNLESQVDDRRQQLAALESVLASRHLTQRVMPGGLPLIGGWISSHFGYRTDPFSGRGAFHAGVDFAGEPGSKVIAVGVGVVSFSGYKSGYGNVVEIYTRPAT